MSGEDEYPLRTVGWGPFMLRGERERMQRLKEKYDTPAEQFDREAAAAHDAVADPPVAEDAVVAEDITDLLTALQRAVEVAKAASGRPAVEAEEHPLTANLTLDLPRVSGELGVTIPPTAALVDEINKTGSALNRRLEAVVRGFVRGAAVPTANPGSVWHEKRITAAAPRRVKNTWGRIEKVVEHEVPDKQSRS